MNTNLRISIILAVAIVIWLFSKSESLCAQAQLKSGDFLSSKYVEKLLKTHSPLEAEGNRTINLIVVDRQNSRISVMPILNFHEGGPSFLLKHSGKLELEDSAGLKILNYQLHIITDKKIFFAINNSQTDEFVYIQNIQKLINEICIVGQYVDDKGRKFVFESNGNVTTPYGTTKFIVGVDHIPYRFDYLEDSNTHQVYKFERKQCVLEIYKVLDAIENQYGNNGNNVEPLWSLRMINCESK